MSLVPANDELSVLGYSLGRNEHLRAGRVVVEFDSGFAVFVGFHVRVPVESSAEVFHRRHYAVVLHFESLWHVVPLEVGAAQTTFAIVISVWICVYENRNSIIKLRIIAVDESSRSHRRFRYID